MADKALAGLLREAWLVRMPAQPVSLLHWLVYDLAHDPEANIALCGVELTEDKAIVQTLVQQVEHPLRLGDLCPSCCTLIAIERQTLLDLFRDARSPTNDRPDPLQPG